MPPAGRPRSFNEADVLEKAMQVFWGQGFGGTSVGALEEATGLGRQSLYNAFGDKRGVYVAAIDHYAHTRAAGFAALLDTDDPMVGVERALRAWAAGAKASGCRGCFLLNSVSELSGKDPELVERVGRMLQGQQDLLTRSLVAARDQGRIAAHHEPRALARRLQATGHGLQLMCRLDPEGGAIDDVVADTLASLRPPT
jgi:TetR/AcrR family transcriptional regulator, transcriptional repressor for nem operon